MSFFNISNNNFIEYLHYQLMIRLFGLVALNDPFSTNEGTDEGVSGLVGSVLSMKLRKLSLAKGGLIGPLIKKLVFRNVHMSLLSQKKLRQHLSWIVARLRILHKCPRQLSLIPLIDYHSKLAHDFAVDPTSGHVAVITDKFVDVLNSNGMRIFNVETENSSFSSRVAFGGEDKNKILAVCSGNEIGLYKVPTVRDHPQNMMRGMAKLSCTQKMSSSATVNTVQFSPDGSVLIIGLSDKTVLIFKKKYLSNGTEEWVSVETLPEQTGEITSIAFCQRPEIPLTLAIGLSNNTIKIWEISSDEGKPSCCVDTLAGHSSCVTSVSFHPYFKTLASGSNDKTVKVWIPNANGKFICMLTLEHGSPVRSVAFSPCGFLVSGGKMMDLCKIWRIFMSTTCVNAELVLFQFVGGGIDQLIFCPKTGNLRIRTYNGLISLE